MQKSNVSIFYDSNKNRNKLMLFFCFCFILLIIFSNIDLRGGSDFTAADGEYWYHYTEAYSGAGTAANPYIIDTPQKLGMVQLNTKNGLHLSSYFKITKNLDMSEHIFFPIAYDYRFTGTIDGNYCTLMNVRMVNGWSGIVERLNGGTIKNLGLVDISVNKTYAGGFVGSICGYIEGNTQITNCFVSGGSIFSAGSVVGGLVGYAENSTITNCFVNNVTLTMTPQIETTYKYKRYYETTGQVYNEYMDTILFPVDLYLEKIETKNYIGKIGGLVGQSNLTNNITNCYANINNMTNTNETSYVKTTTRSFSKTDNDFGAYAPDYGMTVYEIAAIATNRETFDIVEIGETAYNSEYTGQSITTSSEHGPKSPYYGLAEDMNNFSNCYYTFQNGTGSGKISIDSLKGYASRLGSDFTQTAHINGGFPYLKNFYWQNSV